MVSNEEKTRVWDAYRNRKPIRVPVAIGVNPRVIVLDPKWNPRGVSFREYYFDPRVTIDVQIRFMDFQGEYLCQFNDNAAGRPKEWTFYIDNQNIYDAAYFGCPVHFRDGQVPDITPILTGADKERIFAFDADHPLDNPFVRECFARREALASAAASASLPGVAFKTAPVAMGFDGAMTIAVQLRGEEFLSDLIEDPPYAVRLMEFISRAAEVRNRALAAAAGQKVFEPPSGGYADDSIQMISLAMYKEIMLPLHRKWYALFGPGPHFIHLCGDATRHFPTIHEELNVCAFDTGFPVDHGRLRRELGPDVEISGGPEVALLVGGTPAQVYERTKGILLSGIKTGGRFILKEANNLPPCVPESSLRALYQACLDHGGY